MSANTEGRHEPTGGRQKTSLRSMLIWAAIAIVGAICWAVLALSRGEQISALWILFAALASYFIAYRFYARFIATECSRSTTPGRGWAVSAQYGPAFQLDLSQ